MSLVLDLTCVDAIREDPGSSAESSCYQTSAEAVLDFRRKSKVL